MWIDALERAANRQGIKLSAPASWVMNAIAWENASASRRVTLRRPLRRKDDPAVHVMTWGFWTDDGEEVEPVLLIEESGPPTDERTDHYFSLFKEWLLDEVPADVFREAHAVAPVTSRP